MTEQISELRALPGDESLMRHIGSCSQVNGAGIDNGTDTENGAGNGSSGTLLLSSSSDTTLLAPYGEDRKGKYILGTTAAESRTGMSIPISVISTVDIYHQTATEASRPSFQSKSNPDGQHQSSKGTGTHVDSDVPDFDARRFHQLCRSRRSFSFGMNNNEDEEGPLPGFKLLISKEDRAELESPSRISGVNNFKNIMEKKQAQTRPRSLSMPTQLPAADTREHAGSKGNEPSGFPPNEYSCNKKGSPEPEGMKQVVPPTAVGTSNAKASQLYGNRVVVSKPVTKSEARGKPDTTLDHKRWQRLQIRLVEGRNKENGNKNRLSVEEPTLQASPAAFRALTDLARTVNEKRKSDPFVLHTPSSTLYVSSPSFRLRETLRYSFERAGHSGLSNDLAPSEYKYDDEISAVTSLYLTARPGIGLDRMASLAASSTLSSWEMLSVDEAAGADLECNKKRIGLTMIARIIRQVRVILRRSIQIIFLLIVVKISLSYFNGGTRNRETHTGSCASSFSNNLANYIAPSISERVFHNDCNESAGAVVACSTVSVAKRGFIIAQRAASTVHLPEHPIMFIQSLPSRLYAGLANSLLTLIIRAAELGSQSISWIISFIHQMHDLAVPDEQHVSFQRRRTVTFRSGARFSRRTAPRPTKEATMSWRPHIAESTTPIETLIEEPPNSKGALDNDDDASCPIQASEPVIVPEPTPLFGRNTTNQINEASAHNFPISDRQSLPELVIESTESASATSENEFSSPMPFFALNSIILGGIHAGRIIFIEPNEFETCFRPQIDLRYENIPRLFEEEQDTVEQAAEGRGIIEKILRRGLAIVDGFLDRLEEDLFI